MEFKVLLIHQGKVFDAYVAEVGARDGIFGRTLHRG
jgi:hypothetical protein